MEGSPVRGQHRARIVQLNQAKDLQSFQAELTRLLTYEVQHAEIFFALMDRSSKGLPLPAWVKSHLDRHPGLNQKLEQGELVGISHTENNPVPRPATAARASVVLIPVINDAVLYGAVGVVSAMDSSHVSAEDIEIARQFAHDAAPIVARLTEIDELRMANRELREEKKALDAGMQMRSHLQSNVAHDFRTPLAAIRGYARMILDGRSGEINDTQREYLRVVTENTNRLINTVSWMSHVADLASQHFDLATFDLRDVWSDCVESSQAALEDKSVTLTQNIPADPFVIMGDREKFSYVFDQLIAAAIQFTDPQGRITAEFSHGRNQEITVKVSENGAGIPAETLNKIFDRSFNAIPAAPRAQAVSGVVSLSGVYDVVGMHGGRMFVNSTTGKGSTFLFTLPAVKLDGEEKLA
jgi:signal transduction histidine kinase